MLLSLPWKWRVRRVSAGDGVTSQLKLPPPAAFGGTLPRKRGRDHYLVCGTKLRSKLPGDGMNLRSRPGVIADTGLMVMRGADGGPTAS